eukprot:722912-Amphidinium_carterae.1
MSHQSLHTCQRRNPSSVASSSATQRNQPEKLQVDSCHMLHQAHHTLAHNGRATDLPRDIVMARASTALGNPSTVRVVSVSTSQSTPVLFLRLRSRH